jgi:hypothetical protein
MRRPRRRLPSPALVLASIALFVALGGAGFAASVALVKSAQPTMLVSGGVGTDGKATGAGVSGGRASEGVVVITIRGDMFARPTATPKRLRATITPLYSVQRGARMCGIGSEKIASNGGATAEVDCFEFVPGTGWQPADTAFDFQIVGPGR